MSRPRSELTKFILSLPMDLPAKDVVRKANQKGLTTTESNVQRVRGMARRAAVAGANENAATSARRGITVRVGSSSQVQARTAPLSKSDFIRSRPATDTAADVVAAAKAAGLTIAPYLVYKVRAERKAPRSATTAKEALAGPVVETNKKPEAQPAGDPAPEPPQLRLPRATSPVAGGERADPSSALPGLDDLVRAATVNEVRRETAAIDALRIALADYEGALVGLARARVVARVAVALGATAPAVPDASEARTALVAAMGALSAHLGLNGTLGQGQVAAAPDGQGRASRHREPVARRNDETAPVDDAEEAPEPPLRHVPGAVSAPPEAPGVADPRDNTSVVSPVLHDGPVESTDVDRRELQPAPLPAADVEGPRALSKEQVQAFFEGLAVAPAAPPVRPPAARDHERDVLRTLLARAGSMGDLSHDAGGVDELDALDTLTADTTSWTALSKPAQHLWLSFLVARARRLKDWTAANLPSARKRMHEVIVRLPTFAREARPGHINGMRPDHGPVRASWGSDAEAFLSELRAYASIEHAPPASVESPRETKKAKASEKERPESEPIDWPLRERVGSMRVVLFGGEPREEARQNLQRMLGIGTLEWPESGKPRRVEALATSIANGKHHVLLVLRGYVAHTESSRLVEAAKRRGTPYAFVDSGYGIAAVREAIEVALQGA